MMLQHHHDGLDMARVAEQKAASLQVKTLARKIREGQEREARELKSFADDTEAPTPRGTSGREEDAAAAPEHQAHMQQSKTAIDRVRASTGKAVDRAFLEEMTTHHEMGVHMIRNTRFENARLKGLADQMAANQTREIGELTRTRRRVS